jgi:hypothetical protein
MAVKGPGGRSFLRVCGVAVGLAVLAGVFLWWLWLSARPRSSLEVQASHKVGGTLPMKPVLKRPFCAEDIYRLFCWYYDEALRAQAAGQRDAVVGVGLFTEEVAELGPDASEALWEAVRARYTPPRPDLPVAVDMGYAFYALMKMDIRHGSNCYAELFAKGRIRERWERQDALEIACNSGFLCQLSSGLAKISCDESRGPQERADAAAALEEVVGMLERDPGAED